jgi:hypothetical protein
METRTMKNASHAHGKRPFRTYLTLTIQGLIAALALTGLITVGWNLSFPEILGIERIDGKAGFGLVLLGIVAVCLIRVAFHNGRHAHKNP